MNFRSELNRSDSIGKSVVASKFTSNLIISMLILVNFTTNKPVWKYNRNVNVGSFGFLLAIATTIKSIFARLPPNH